MSTSYNIRNLIKVTTTQVAPKDEKKTFSMTKARIETGTFNNAMLLTRRIY